MNSFAHREQYVHEELKLCVRITNDVGLLRKAWDECNLGNVDSDFLRTFCGKIGAIKQIDFDHSSEIAFVNHTCYIPSSCCVVIGHDVEGSIIPNL